MIDKQELRKIAEECVPGSIVDKLINALVEERARYNYCVGTQRVWHLCKDPDKWRTQALHELGLDKVWPPK